VSVGAWTTQDAAGWQHQALGLLSAHWRGLGLWLSLWDRHGRCLARDELAVGPFEVLWRHSPAFRKALRRLSRQAAGDADRPSPARAETAGFVTFAVPFAPGGATECVIVAALVPKGFSKNEELAALCRQTPLDPNIPAELAEQIAWHDTRAIAGLQELLCLLLDQIAKAPEATQPIENLSSNLAQTYEVLNLLYHLTDECRHRQTPSDFFERTFAEVLAVLQVETLAAVAQIPNQPDKPTTILVGKAQRRKSEIQQAAGTLAERMADAEPLVLAGAQVQEHLAQADWIRNLVAVRLCRRNEPIGVLLAINKAPGKPFDTVDLQLLEVLADRCSIYLEDLHLFADLQELLIALLRSLVNSIDAMDPYTSGHSERVALIARRLAEHMGCHPAFCQRTYFGGLLHDIGKIAVPPSVLCKPGRLSPDEVALIRQHPINGARLIQRIQAMHDIVPAILSHHERIDGKGYPFGVRGGQTPTLAKIVAVADCFDAMISKRAYRPAKGLDRTKTELFRMAGTHLDPELVRVLLKMDLEKLCRELGSYHSGLIAERKGLAPWQQPLS